MQVIYLDEADNTLGADPTVSVYNAVQRGFPALELTKDNSKIISVQPAATVQYPTMKRVVILKGENPNDWFEFFYVSHFLDQILIKHLFNEEQLAHINTLTNSAELVDYIGQVTNINIRSEDFWCSKNSIDYCGGTKTPNFYLEAKSDAIWYGGSIILNLWIED